jgi:hypothetical protein
MRAREEAEASGSNHARIEGIAEHLLDLGETKRIAAQITQTRGDSLGGQIAQRV